jgi:hypothetical protein
MATARLYGGKNCSSSSSTVKSCERIWPSVANTTAKSQSSPAPTRVDERRLELHDLVVRQVEAVRLLDAGQAVVNHVRQPEG